VRQKKNLIREFLDTSPDELRKFHPKKETEKKKGQI
jgi:hypothetical protein